MYYAIASVRKLQMKLNITNKREEQVLMPRKMDTSVIFSTKRNRTGNMSPCCTLEVERTNFMA